MNCFVRDQMSGQMLRKLEFDEFLQQIGTNEFRSLGWK